MHDKDLNEARFACLIRLGKYTKVLENQPGHFQKAYCLFRLGRLEDALRECDECDDAHCSIALQHLRAQIHYRHKDFELSRAIYEKLIVADEDRKMDDDEYRLSLIANLYATSVASHDPSSALGLQDPEVIIAKEAEEAEMIGGCPHMELLYNVGSALIWDSQWYAAERALTLAEETCRKEMAQDGISEVEVSSELAMIMVQRAIALCRTDRNDEAKKVDVHQCIVSPIDALHSCSTHCYCHLLTLVLYICVYICNVFVLLLNAFHVRATPPLILGYEQVT